LITAVTSMARKPHTSYVIMSW